MSRKLLIRDLTMRDGQQSMFATRMTQSQIDRLLPYYKKAGFYALEVWGGAVPDSVMRYLNENPWDRLKKISEAIEGVSLLTALSRGRNLFGYAPYPDEVIMGFCQESISSGLNVMRIFDALNDLENVKSTVKLVKEAGGIADGAICYTVGPHYSFGERCKALLKGKKLPGDVFNDDYFVSKAAQFESLGADMITIKDMAGLINPARISKLLPKLKQAVNIPIDFHTHCTPGYGLASVVMAITKGVDIVDTNIWYFAGGPAAPALELVYYFCKKMDVEVGADMEVVAQINNELYEIRQELASFDVMKSFPKPFNPLTDVLPQEIDQLFDTAIAAAQKEDEHTMLTACQAIDEYFNFPKPNLVVQKAEVPGGMYTNMLAQLKQMGADDMLDRAMELIPQVRLDAGLIPLVTPTSQIVGSQAVNCAIDEKNGKPMYTSVSNQFISLVKGEYGTTPVSVNPEFREKITGSKEEKPYNIANYSEPANPELPECGGVKLASDHQEVLLLELFPSVAAGFLRKGKETACSLQQQAEAERKAAEEEAKKPKVEPITGATINAPMCGRIMEFYVKPGDAVKKGDRVLMYEAMKMENALEAEFGGIVKRTLIELGTLSTTDQPLIEFE